LTFSLHFDLSVPVMAEAYHDSGLPRIITYGAISAYLNFYSLQDKAAYSVHAQVQLDSSNLTCMIHAKTAQYKSVTLNRFFPLAGAVLIPKADCQTQKPCASYWKDDKELCLAGHCDLHACDTVNSSSSPVSGYSLNSCF
jgi:hypothetical protein